MAAGARLLFLLLSLLIAVPMVIAQAPLPVDPRGDVLHITVQCTDSFLEPPYVGQDTVTCTVQDVSRDSASVPGSGTGQGADAHIVSLAFVPSVDGAPGNATPSPQIVVSGYHLMVDTPFINMYGGEVRSFTVTAKATPLVSAQDADAFLAWTYRGPSGYVANGTVPFHVEVQNYDSATVRMTSETQIQTAGQDDIRVYTIEVANVGVYPDIYRISVNVDSDLAVTTPPDLYVPPGETRYANLMVLTPHDKLFEVGRSTALIVKVSSVTGSGVYSTVGILNVYGPYVPVYWIPVFLVGLVSAGVVTRGARDKIERTRLERGRPRHVELTPKQAILLAELKRTDRERYQQKRRALDAVYAERLAEFRAHKKERDDKDAAEARLAKQELKEEKQRRKAARKAEYLAKKAQKKEEKKLRAAERKQAKIDAKEDRKKGKVLAKKRKQLEKAQAKLAKQEAKEAAAQAKLDAKAAKEAKKAQKAAAREAKKK